MTGRWSSALLALVLALLVATPALAQGIDITGTVDTNEIGIGDTLTYTLQTSTASNEAPTDPRLTAHPGFTIVDQAVSPSHMVSIVNGRTTEKHGLNASWTLRADQLGTFTIGPASVAFHRGRRSPASGQTVRVLPPGQSKPRRKPRPSFDPFGGGSPFDPFKGIFPDEPSDPLGAVSADPKLGLDSPRGPVAFLHATVDKTRAVVGEQVVLNVYLYEDLHARQGRPSDVHEATANDFVKRSLLQDETRATHVGDAMVGGKPWSVKLVRKNALFPIKAGRLAIAPMSLTLPQARVGLRESETLYVDVTEPPVAGRPAGYQLGDTGDFSLSGTIAPRVVEQHGAIGVTVELRGSGNIPAALPPPEIAGVEWLEPQTRDSLGPAANERFGGTRTFSYVVRIHKAGAVDLGEIRLPYWDPQARAYNVARTALGIVQVTPSEGRDAGADVADTILPDLPKARTSLEGRREASFVTERASYWAFVFGSPLACVAAIAASATVRRARERRANAAPSPERLARSRSREADAALRGTDGGAALAAVLRAIEAEVLARAGVNLRGTGGEGAIAELTGAGVTEAAARAVVDTVSACEQARFSPGGVSIDDARALWARARSAIEAVGTNAEGSVPPPRGERA